MKEPELENLSNELQSIAERYNLKHISFCGLCTEDDKEQFIGLIAIDFKRYSDFMESAMCIGRLWQSAREKTMGILNKFEGKLYDKK